MPGVPFSNIAAEWQIPVLQRAFGRLGGQVRFIQYDGRGSGQSQRDVDDLSLDAMLRDLDAVLDAERVGRVVLLGFYHSVMLALAWAARHPARASGLVLFGGSARGWDPMSGPGTQALLTLIDRDWDTFVESAAHAWLGWPDPEARRQSAEWFRTATTPAIAKATMREASAIDVRPELRRPMPGPRAAPGGRDGHPRGDVARPRRRPCRTLGSSCCPARQRACSSRIRKGSRTGSRPSRPRRRRPRPTRRHHPSARPRGPAGRRRRRRLERSRRARRRSSVPSRRASRTRRSPRAGDQREHRGAPRIERLPKDRRPRPRRRDRLGPPPRPRMTPREQAPVTEICHRDCEASAMTGRARAPRMAAWNQQPLPTLSVQPIDHASGLARDDGPRSPARRPPDLPAVGRPRAPRSHDRHRASHAGRRPQGRGRIHHPDAVRAHDPVDAERPGRRGGEPHLEGPRLAGRRPAGRRVRGCRGTLGPMRPIAKRAGIETYLRVRDA